MPRRSSSSVKVFYPRYDLDQLVVLLRRGLEALQVQLPVKRAILFGSYAKRRHTAASDIDILIVYNGPARPDAYELTRKILNIRRLEPHVFSEQEYAGLRSVIDRMTSEGICLIDHR